MALGVGGAVLVTVFWLARGNMWNAVVVAVALTLVFLLYRMFRERKFMATNAVGLVLVIVVMLLVPSRLESTTLGGYRPPATPLAIPTPSQPAPPEGHRTRAINQIRDRRRQIDVEEVFPLPVGNRP